MVCSKLYNITPVILAGGKSSRMGRNKSFVTLAGKPLIEMVVSIVTEIFKQPPIIITNSPELYQYLGLAMESDIFKDKGPLAGIHTGLSCSQTDYIFIFGCDMPLLEPDFIKHMVERLTDEQILVPRQGSYVEPLHALYARTCLSHIESKLKDGSCKIQSFFNEIKIGYVDVEEYGNSQKSFFNVNSEADLTAAETVYLKSHK